MSVRGNCYMKKLWNDLSYFLKNKIYMIVVSLTALFSYGFAMTHPSIGIDDTCIGLYFEEGLAPAVGRWVLYLLNKLITLDIFLPWMTEVVAVAIFVLSVTLWCVLIRRVVKREVGIWGYTLFAALFLSCPLISEVFVFYLHNGICIAYGITAIAIMELLDAIEQKSIWRLLFSAGCLTIALGCYESFMIVYLIGILVVFFLIRLQRDKNQVTNKEKPHFWIIAALISVAGAVIFRTVIVRILQWIYGFAIPEDFTVTARGVIESLTGSETDFAIVLKRFWVMHYLNGFCYLPITVLVLAIFALVVYGITQAIRRKDVFLALSMVCIPLAPLAMVVIEGLPTHYRASQYVPLIGAFAVFLCFYEMAALKGKGIEKTCRLCAVALGFVLLWNQSVQMNQWFYVDYLKYEDTKQVMEQIAYDLQKDHDISKPIIFKGAYMVPYEIAKDAYLPFYSAKYQTMKKIADVVDPHLLEKYNAEDGRGYVFAETPVASTFRWGVTAFDGTPRELQAFWNMHGYSFSTETDLERIDGAYDVLDKIPPYPQAGYIYENEENIIIHVSNQ